MSIHPSLSIIIQPFFLIVILLLGWFISFSVIGMFIWALIIAFSVFFHELGHALTAIFFGQKTIIELTGFGGITQRRGEKLSLWKDFLITLNGPLLGLSLGLLSLFIAQSLKPSLTIWDEIFTALAYINLFWTFFNLLPVYPLDGGHLLGVLMQGILGFRGMRISFLISVFTGLGLSLFLLLYGLILPGIILLLFSYESYRSWNVLRYMTEEDQNEHLKTQLEKAKNLMMIGEDHQALEMLQSIRTTAHRGYIYLSATEHMAFLLEKLGEEEDAYQMLKEAQKKLTSMGTVLLHRLAFKRRDYALCNELSNAAFQYSPSSQVAEINALSQASLGNTRAAIGWLQRAIQEGCSHIGEVINRPEINPIRNSTEFQRWVDTGHNQT
ncbi:MAG: hypothetical protein Tsb0021_01200 [Chlamydiales bacterium]